MKTALIIPLLLLTYIISSPALATTYYVNGTSDYDSYDALSGSLEGMQDRSEIRQTVSELYGKLPLSFVENKGQFDEQVRFKARSPRATVYFTPTEVVFHFVEKGDPSALTEQGRSDDGAALPGASVPSVTDTRTTRRELALRVSFPGANENPAVVGEDELEGRINVFRRNDPSKWLTDIPLYGGVVYRDLWQGIDLAYHGEEGYGLKYDLVVHPKANPDLVQMRYEGHDGLRVNSDGELIIETAFGPILEKKPYIYQDINGKRVEASGSFVVQSDTVTWHIGDYDTSHSLIIDPGLVYSSFLGGSDNDGGLGIVVDSDGCAYVTGYTSSFDFPVTPGAYDTTYNGGYDDTFVTKLNTSGGDLVYSTFLGGSNYDVGYGIVIDSEGCAYVAGYTDSSDFPVTPGAYDTTHNNGGDVFLTKLDATGGDLVYSTFLGGSSSDYGLGIAINAEGCAYVTGYADSSDFPVTPGAYDTTHNNGRDVFVTKLDAVGGDLVYSTFLGGSDWDYSHGIVVDASGCAYVTGYTKSFDFPVTPGAYDTTFNGSHYDAFVTKVNASGGGLVYSTFLGGSRGDGGDGIAVDASGCAYVTGKADSSDFPVTPGAYDTTHNNGSDVFVTKLDTSGGDLVYSTFLGGSSSDYNHGIAVDAEGCAHVTGTTRSSDFPVTTGAYDTTFNGVYRDTFVTKLNTSGGDLVYSTFLGGNDWDYGFGIAVDSSGCAYVTGDTESIDFPMIPGAYDTTFNGGLRDAFVTKLSLITKCYVSDTEGDDAYDGLSSSWDGTHGPKKTIQAGIDASSDGDTVLVANGTYTGASNRNLDFYGKDIILQSVGGRDNTIINMETAARGFHLHSGETRNAVIDGFTILNGYTYGNGGAMLCVGSSPTIRNCKFTNNVSGASAASSSGCSSADETPGQEGGGEIHFTDDSDAAVLN